MAAVGKNSTSLRKKDLVTQKGPTVAYNPLLFQHRAAAGETGLNLAQLFTPAEAAQNGFVQPSATRLAAAELKRNSHSLKLVSSVAGVLQPYVSYVVSGNLQIRFIGFTALEGEIFTGYIDPTPVTGASIVDISAVPKTGVLAAGQTDINVGEAFKVNLHPSQQVGQYQLEIDGIGQFRNTGNSSVVLDGNYYEVDTGDGTGTLLRLNSAPVIPVSYKVIPIGSVLERPAGSALTVIEQQQGVINKLIEVVSDLSGLPEDQLTAAPTYPDLKAFGDRVLQAEEDIDAAQADITALKDPTLLSDAQATTLGYMTYVIGSTYNSVTLDITASVGTRNAQGGTLRPFMTKNGTWFVEYHLFYNSSTSDLAAGTAFSIPGMNISVYDTATMFLQHGGNYGYSIARADIGALNWIMRNNTGPGASGQLASWSGTLQLTAKPTFAF
jgi:hypothetical protein